MYCISARNFMFMATKSNQNNHAEGVEVRYDVVLLEFFFVVFVNRLNNHKQAAELVIVGRWKITSLFFVDPLVRLVSSRKIIFAGTWDQGGLKLALKSSMSVLKPKSAQCASMRQNTASDLQVQVLWGLYIRVLEAERKGWDMCW